MDVTTMEVQPKVPDGLIDKEGIVNYTFEGQAKRAAWIQLRNGMRLNVSVPVSEINESWIKWVIEILIIFAFLLILFIIIIITFTGHITKPLRDLTKTAEEVDSGNYDCNLDYDENDEVGALTQTFKKLTEHLKLYIEDLNDRAYTDSLTSLHNKGAFDVTIKSIQSQINGKDNTLKFAVCMFDCNDLKRVNDTKGHDKGNIYLKEAADTICKVFSNSPVFRIGGDEFAAILLDKDFDNRDKLIEEFDKICEEKQKEKSLSWEQLDVARGLAIYDPTEDSSVSDVVRRADRLMYENKWSQKEKRRQSLENK